MYMVRTYLAASGIQGVGVFAGEDIKKGDIVWMWIEGVDKRLDPKDVANMPPVIQAFIDRHCYVDEGQYMLCGDNGKYTNHSEEPNVVNGPGDTEIAARDIMKGEEITSDYRVFDEGSKGIMDFDGVDAGFTQEKKLVNA